MLLVQDQYRQNGRKNFETELQLKQDTTKQLFSDPKDIWEIESNCEEEIITSGNDSEQEENVLFEEPSELPEETLETRRSINPIRKKSPKNVRFQGSDFNYVLDTSETSSFENDYLGVNHGYGENEIYKHRCSINPEPEICHKVKDHLRVSHKPKWCTVECGYDKKFSYDRRPQSSPERSTNYPENLVVERRPISLGERNEAVEARHRIRRKEHRCGRSHHETDHVYGEMPCRKMIHKPYKFEYSDSFVRQRHGDHCEHCQEDEGRVRLDKKKNYPKIKPASSLSHKHACHMVKDAMENEGLSKIYKKSCREVRMPQDSYLDNQSFACQMADDRYCEMEEYYDHATNSSKSKKKILEAVQEQQEQQFSDSTYKISCPKYSSQTIPGEFSILPGKRSFEKLTNSSQSDWLYCGGRSMNNSFGEKVQPVRIHKMRSRRTRMNRLKNGWKKAFVQTVRDGSGNERVGVIVMGSKGPEFFSKNVKKPCGSIPFRKSKSFLDRAVKSFEVMTVDCKNVFLSSSEPGPRASYMVNDLECPEDVTKVEEKIAKFSKNMNEIVKSSEEKFYNSLSNNGYQNDTKAPTLNIFKGAGEGTPEGEQTEKSKNNMMKMKYSPFHLLPFETLSPRIPKSFRKPQKKINEDSKAMAEALNKQAKAYKENPPSLKEREETFLQELKELQEKFPPKEISQETVEANLSLWGMKLDVSEKVDVSTSESKSEPKEETVTEKNQKEVEDECGDDAKTEKRTENKEKTGREEMSQTGSVKSTEQISMNKQRRKKYYETTGSRTPTSKLEDNSCAGDAPILGNSEITSKATKRLSKVTKWTDSLKDPYAGQTNEIEKEVQNPNRNTISAVFRDLVENGSAISQEESENLQNILNRATGFCSNDHLSSSSSEIVNMKLPMNVTPRSPTSVEGAKSREKESGRDSEGFVKKQEKERRSSDVYYEEEKSAREDENERETKIDDKESEIDLGEGSKRKTSKIKKYFDEKMADPKSSRKESKRKEGRSRKKIICEDKMRLLREALPSIAAENEAAHLKQLKKYIDRFIDRVEASTTSEFRKRKETRLKAKDCLSTESSEVRVDAKKILDFVSNPFKKISSDVTINIARKLTDALVQEKCSKGSKKFSKKTRKNLEDETEIEGFGSHEATSGSEAFEEPEPTYLKQLKRMRNEHLNNIVLEVKRLSELLRFLDRCNRITF